MHEELLLRVRDMLYDGSWELLEADLRGRLNAAPRIPQLDARITEDLATIQKLKENK